jgi:LDH2 family malate/lactate/ureidoglycolate dehydrogenase
MLEEEGVRLPGERRRDATAHAEHDGIELGEELLDQIKGLAIA